MPPNATPGRRQDQLSCPLACSPVPTPPKLALLYCPVKVQGPLSHVLQPVGAEPAFSLSPPRGWLTCVFTIRASFTVLPRRGVAPTLPNHSQRGGRARSSALMTLEPALPATAGGATMPPHNSNGASSPMLLPSWLAHLHPLHQGQLYCAVQMKCCSQQGAEPAHDLRASSPYYHKNSFIPYL